MTVRDLMTLQLAGATYRYEGAREHDAHHLVGYTPTRFRQRVNALLDDPRSLQHAPQVVHRLRRVRDLRRSARRS